MAEALGVEELFLVLHAVVAAHLIAVGHPSATRLGDALLFKKLLHVAPVDRAGVLT